MLRDLFAEVVVYVGQFRDEVVEAGLNFFETSLAVRYVAIFAADRDGFDGIWV